MAVSGSYITLPGLYQCISLHCGRFWVLSYFAWALPVLFEDILVCKLTDKLFIYKILARF